MTLTTTPLPFHPATTDRSRPSAARPTARHRARARTRRRDAGGRSRTTTVTNAGTSACRRTRASTSGSSAGTPTRASSSTTTVARPARSPWSRASCSRRRAHRRRTTPAAGDQPHRRQRAGLRPGPRPLGREPDRAGRDERARLLAAARHDGLLRADARPIVHPCRDRRRRRATRSDAGRSGPARARRLGRRGCGRERDRRRARAGTRAGCCGSGRSKRRGPSGVVRCSSTPGRSNCDGATVRSRARSSIDRNVLEWRLDPTSDHRAARGRRSSRLVIVVCDEGYASSFAAVSLQDLGLSNATDLVGGFQAWRAAGPRGTRAAATEPS